MNRGTAGQRVFCTRRDGERFFTVIGEASDRFAVEVHAFCLMNNHFHLLLRSTGAEISSFMQHIGRSYTQYLNARLRRDGSVFRGRFTSELVDSEAYLTAAGRYIHRNPSDIRPPVALDRYRWSSYRHYTTSTAGPPWLRTDVLLALEGGPTALRAAVETASSPIDAASLLRATRWVLSETVDDCASTATTRLLATAAADRLGPTDRARVLDGLGFPSPASRRMARSRAHRRVRLEPILAELVERSLRRAA